jgi:hypothetical protein
MGANTAGSQHFTSVVHEQKHPNSLVQKRLIDAAAQAGVKRFAPNEWATQA